MCFPGNDEHSHRTFSASTWQSTCTVRRESKNWNSVATPPEDISITLCFGGITVKWHLYLHNWETYCSISEFLSSPPPRPPPPPIIIIIIIIIIIVIIIIIIIIIIIALHVRHSTRMSKPFSNLFNQCILYRTTVGGAFLKTFLECLDLFWFFWMFLSFPQIFLDFCSKSIFP